jgi:N-methylhydantoinase A
MGYFCGIDIGGTFTDCVVLDDSGQITLAKVSSTPPRFSEGFLNAIDAVAGRLGIGSDEFLGQTDLLLHGTTVGTNALVQMKGARTGLITTKGHGDALIIMRSAGRSRSMSCSTSRTTASPIRSCLVTGSRRSRSASTGPATCCCR